MFGGDFRTSSTSMSGLVSIRADGLAMGTSTPDTPLFLEGIFAIGTSTTSATLGLELGFGLGLRSLSLPQMVSRREEGVAMVTSNSRSNRRVGDYHVDIIEIYFLLWIG
jgi:hypothetical protein